MIKQMQQKCDKKKIQKNDFIQYDQEKIAMSYNFYIKDILIYFPYEPYETQIEYMKFVIDILNNDGNFKDQNGILESPTGTGKTLCQLCAVFAWINHQKIQKGFNENKFQILYCSRTHSQLQQVAQQINKTVYRPKTLTRASQKQFQNISNPEQNNQSKKSTNTTEDKQEDQIYQIPKIYKGTQYINHKDPYQIQINDLIFNKNQKVSDLEDFKKNCEYLNIDPYKTSKKIQNKADIILLSYKYLLDKQVQQGSNIDIENSIVIFDEGHSVPKECEECKSIEINSQTVQNVINLLYSDILVRKNEINIDLLQKCKKLLSQIENQVITQWDQIENINSYNLQNFIEYMEQYVQQLQEEEEYLKINVQNVSLQQEQFQQNFEKIKKKIKDINYQLNFAQILKEFFQNLEYFKMSYKPFQFEITQETQKNIVYDNSVTTLTINCLDPSLAFEDLMTYNPYKIFIISGTLKPFEQFKRQLKADQFKTFEGKVVFNPQTQVLGAVVVNGVDQQISYEMTSENLNNNSKNIYNDIGISIQQLIKYIPNGVLVIFTTYKKMQECYQVWKDNGIINDNDTIEGKHVFIENQSQIEFSCKICKTLMQNQGINQFEQQEQLQDYKLKCQQCTKLQIFQNFYLQCKKHHQKLICKECVKKKGNFINLYKEYCQDQQGAILFSVFRAKNTEGIDFTDNLARAVFIIGQPYLPIKDKLIIKKRQYQKNNFKNQDWYFLEMQKELKQAIGRIHRHQYDWGGIFLYDQRYGIVQKNKYLPDWLKQGLNKYKDQNILLENVKKFYQTEKPQQIKSQQKINKEKQTKLQKAYQKGYELYEKMKTSNQTTQNTRQEPINCIINKLYFTKSLEQIQINITREKSQVQFVYEQKYWEQKQQKDIPFFKNIQKKSLNVKRKLLNNIKNFGESDDLSQKLLKKVKPSHDNEKQPLNAEDSIEEEKQNIQQQAIKKSQNFQNISQKQQTQKKLIQESEDETSSEENDLGQFKDLKGNQKQQNQQDARREKKEKIQENKHIINKDKKQILPNSQKNQKQQEENQITQLIKNSKGGFYTIQISNQGDPKTSQSKYKILIFDSQFQKIKEINGSNTNKYGPELQIMAIELSLEYINQNIDADIIFLQSNQKFIIDALLDLPQFIQNKKRKYIDKWKNIHKTIEIIQNIKKIEIQPEFK